jgi:penicillin-binding protein 2
MRISSEHAKLLTRRTAILAGVHVTTAAILAGRLYHLQFIKADTYQTLAEDNRINLQLIPPERGKLLDIHGEPLANNQPNYRVVMKKENRKKNKERLKRLRDMLLLSDFQMEKVEKELARVGRGHTVLVTEYLSWEDVARLEFNAPYFPGILIESGYMRTYPLADKASHLIGYVGAVTEKELQGAENKALLRLPGFKLAKDGIEKTYEERLRGSPGMLHMEVNAHGLPVQEVKRQPSVKGEDITLTLDSRLQRYASERFGEESGAAVLMRVPSGEVMALASMPAFDPNRFSKGITNKYWKELLDNPKNPLMNKAIAGQYPPGSTFKMLVGLAALEHGLINELTSIYCPGHFYLGNHRFNCWKPGGHGSMNIKHAIEQSCDTFFYHMAQRLGMDKIAELSRRFGLGDPTGIALQNEKKGIMPDKEWKRSRHGQPWHPGDTINSGIGQGYVLATPIQLAVMTARLVTGREVKPTLTPATGETAAEMLDVSEENLRIIQEGMMMVSNGPRGTAYWNSIRNGPYRMGGKTGTSQVRKITVRGQDQNTIPWHLRHHGLFVGYAPVEKPEFIVSVVVEHGGGGSSAAAPVARDILQKTLDLYSPATDSAKETGVS